MNITPEWVSAIAAMIGAIGVLCAFGQLNASKHIAQLQFEDGLAKEYRELASQIPTKALLGQALDDEEYESAFGQLFRYIDLSNEQVCLRRRKRISADVWKEWSSGIQSNLAMPAFARAWQEIKQSTTSFSELRRLESETFATDPARWD
ncbi:hypothetical protein GCM10007933_17740 [Zoogloea oryzae]|uniref:DUF4760 domain-containing protein n=1 Tax=Zoogloea oryzae TaxID=310767 RepID=A0ABQ6F9R8_9RHOO|nr:hypothetical protein [Zoogloea oryzae]GLT22315.1 hypothetical protein GCM10007933_17740 [Zoogloea oryzae]